MPPLLLDTHVWIWEVSGDDRQLSPSARREIGAAAQDGRLWLSSISIWEISMLAFLGKVKLDKPTPDWIKGAMTRSRILIEPLAPEIALEAGAPTGGFRSDPADQIIVATARAIGATLLTRDRRILDYAARGYVTVMRV